MRLYNILKPNGMQTILSEYMISMKKNSIMPQKKSLFSDQQKQCLCLKMFLEFIVAHSNDENLIEVSQIALDREYYTKTN